jgi:glycine betaine/proline transport system substrate-binding protein
MLAKGIIIMKKVVIVLLSLALLVSCSKIRQKENDIKKNNDNEVCDLKIGCTTYISSYIQAVLLSEIIDRAGYTSKIIIDDTDNMWKNLSLGKTDVILSSWIPTIDTSRRAEIQSLIKDLGSNCRNLSNGIFVPEYTSIGFLNELNEYRDNFSNVIYVCKQSDLTYKETKNMLEHYKLNYYIQPVSYEELDTVIKKSINNKEWIAVALWTPNGKINKFNLRQLRDSENIFTNNIDTHTIINNDFNNNKLINILDNYNIRKCELNELINLMTQNDIEKKIVTSWLDNNLQVIDRIYSIKK